MVPIPAWGNMWAWVDRFGNLTKEVLHSAYAAVPSQWIEGEESSLQNRLDGSEEPATTSRNRAVLRLATGLLRHPERLAQLPGDNPGRSEFIVRAFQIGHWGFIFMPSEVITENLLINVPFQVERLYCNVGAAQSARA